MHFNKKRKKEKERNEGKSDEKEYDEEQRRIIRGSLYEGYI